MISTLQRWLRWRKSQTSQRGLELTPSLCESLGVLAQIFGQTWDGFIVDELRRQMAAKTATSSSALKSILVSLFAQAGKTRPGLVRSFLVTDSQIRYQSLDRRYLVVILQGEGDQVLVTWQMRTRQAGTSSITYAIQGSVWTPTHWEVSPACQADLALLAKDGGEVLGYMGERGLLPEGSVFMRALFDELDSTESLRQNIRPVA